MGDPDGRRGRRAANRDGRDTARPARARAVAVAALRLFAERGYETTTMDDIAVAAGVSRSTVFRYFGSKDDVLFAEHEGVLESVRRQLDSDTRGEPVAAVCAAARMVFQAYVGDPEISVPRYRLVRANAVLRDREIAMTARYQRAFSRHLARGRNGERAHLEAETLAAAIIAAHNHVLRSWLKDPARAVPWARLDDALAYAVRLAGREKEQGTERESGVLVAVYPAGASRDDVLARVRDALEP
ncbi:transcriptional regulator, TetR family [Marinactinospora thermotolerans DSM 45154]|uniref:Transcriptional regulator, TetR family n=2 Tax=Marinactinospora thermotolerans TaxID=531310 RepID=A0A1T4LZ54_9ACTN|nr:transcriptional regulator, TetR family [Marinactinospora thermotolerans DSM 45154]